MKLEMRVIKQKGPMGVGEAVATVDGKDCCEGRAYIYGRLGYFGRLIKCTKEKFFSL